MPEPAALARALEARGAEPLAAIEWLESVVSTNDRLKASARRGAPEWAVVLADVQTGGRGREGRSWVSPAGGLYLSVLLRPRFASIGLLPLAAGVAVAEAIDEVGVGALLKWPNDVLLAGVPGTAAGRSAGGGWVDAGRKLGGILAEATSSSAGVEWVALGIGVNVSAAAGSFPAALRDGVASLADAGVSVSVAQIGAGVLARLRVWYDAVRASPASVIAAWRRHAVPWWGERIEIRMGSDTLRGLLLDVDEEGALVVGTSGGRRRRVVSGDVVRMRRVE